MRRLHRLTKLVFAGFTREEIQVLAPLWLITFVSMADANIIGILLPGMCREFDLSVGYVGGWTKASHAFGAVVGSLLCGPLSDRWGRYYFLLYGSVLFTLFSLLTWLSGSFFVLVVCRAVIGLTTGILTISTVAYLSDVIPYRRRGLAMGFLFCAPFAGLIIGIQAAAYLALWAQAWRAIFLLFGVLSLVSTVSVAWLLSRQHYIGGGGRQGSLIAQSLSEYGRMLLDRPALAALGTVALSTAGMFGAITYIPAFLDHSMGMHEAETASIFLVSGPPALLFALWAGRLADATSKRGVVLASSVALLLMLLVFPRISDRMLYIYLASAVCFGAGAARMGPINAILSELAPPQRRSSLFALRNVASYLGVALGAIGGGALFDSRFGFPGICYGGAVIMLVSLAVVYFGLPEPRTAEDAEILPALASETEVVS
ncbi:MFS transporter [bacterium]|nr:MFS transporter [bacterium]